jgi:hypothetical protein
MLFSKKKRGAGPKSQQSAPALDVGMTVIQEFLNRAPGAMKARSGKSTAHILSDADGAAPNSSALLGMLMLKVGYSVSDMFLAVAAANLLVAIYLRKTTRCA